MHNRYAPPKAIATQFNEPAANKGAWRSRALILVATSATLFGLGMAFLGCVGFSTSERSDTWNMSVSSSCVAYGIACMVAGVAMCRRRRWGAPLWLALSLVTTLGAPMGGSDFSGRGGVFLSLFVCLSLGALWAAWAVSRGNSRRAT